MTDFDDLFDSAMDDLLGKDSLKSQEEADEIINTPCGKCGDTTTPLHVNGVCGNCYTPESVEIKNKEEEEPPILQYRKVKKVPYLKRWPRCGLCKERLLGNRYGWFTEDEDGEHWWWCVRCLEAEDCFPTEEEKLKAEQEASNE